MLDRHVWVRTLSVSQEGKGITECWTTAPGTVAREVFIVNVRLCAFQDQWQVLLDIISSCLERTYGNSVIHRIWTSGLRESHICPHPQPEGSFLPCPFYLYCWTVSQGFSSAHLVNHIDELKQVHSAFVTVESLATTSRKKVRRELKCALYTQVNYSHIARMTGL